MHKTLSVLRVATVGKGLKFGVYTDISLHTCGGSGSQGHYTLDAETYAHDWQVQARSAAVRLLLMTS